ncbi:di-trans,poly-cis-decaprenylcistransferase [Patescibacteria group bacterium]|nr:di-trans,poly-cis-decaprenylcistransferase [Patescibacteria group bacterium]
MSNSDSKKELVPNHIGIIMDGNRRWASERNIPSIEGHLQGYKIAKKTPEWFFEKGVKIVSLFSFSSENWKRSQLEINYLMALLKRAIEEESISAQKKGHKIIVSGKLDELPGDLPDECKKIMRETKNNTNGTINICMNYGGRLEIVEAVKNIVKNKISKDKISEKLINSYLYTKELSDPDLIIRTSGEKRTSGFLLWQSAYSELIFLEKYWPEFEKQDTNNILEEYSRRKRRFGGN